MKISQQFCAFIDILGFKNRMQNFEEALEYYLSYFNTYRLLNEMHNTLVDVEGVNIFSDPDVEDIILSDSIIMHSPNWKALTFRLANIMSWLLSSGFLFRGGVGYGKQYSDIDIGKTCIVSEGLIQAVEIESKVSKYPRIVISQSALSEMLRQADSPFDLKNMMIQSEDNLWFINPFFLNPNIEQIMRTLEHEIERYKGEGFIDKYLWMSELCYYFREKHFVREHPFEYYSKGLPVDPLYADFGCSTIRFFYPKVFSVGAFGAFDYEIDIEIYKQTLKQNYAQLAQQRAEK
jgi:hypothetical protein